VKNSAAGGLDAREPDKRFFQPIEEFLRQSGCLRMSRQMFTHNGRIDRFPNNSAEGQQPIIIESESRSGLAKLSLAYSRFFENQEHGL
jgi:hypothetical protein